MFIDREKELKSLKERYESDKAEFVVIYGRRRVGKSELIDEFLQNRKGIRLLAREEAEGVQLRNFSKKLSTYFNDEFLAKNPFNDWDAFFTYINEKTQKRIVIALDEFPYLIEENRALASILQDYWDNKLKHTKILLILCGSSISMMEKKVLGHKSPLYGRRTAQLLIKPLRFKQTLEYLTEDVKTCIEAFSVFGGTPAYLLEFNKKKDLLTNIKEKILKEDSFLYRDVEFLIREELKEPRYYFSILCSIAKGNTKVSDIINDTGIKKGIVGKYLSILCDLQLVKREVPITENALRSRKGLYSLHDNFFKFWFKYVYTHKEEVESDKQDYIVNSTIKPSLNHYIGPIFEEVCKEALLEMNTPFPINKIGRWWHKNAEIDLIALNPQTREILFCECKWKNNVNAAKILKELKEKAKLVDWKLGKRKEHYAVIAKSFKNKPKEKNVLLFDLKDLKRAFR